MIWPITPTGATPVLSNKHSERALMLSSRTLIGSSILFTLWLSVAAVAIGSGINDEDLSESEWEQIRALEQQRISVINSVAGSVIAVYGENRQGGGAGVIIHPSGIALTNHHVIMGAGVSGWGGLADGNFYRWQLIGTDPGGDVSIIQMEGLDSFPYASLGDSDLVQPGDWAIAMGNPFVLTEDQYPTVTLGIVSGVKRYQPGEGGTMLVYGNCIQIDSSINPGNSGGPLFNLQGQVIGINGRGSFSFKDRGKVNVGLGYAISANQIKNFIPDLLATKLIQHGTLDASFSDRQGRVICSTINRDSPIAAAGLSLGDELLEFEGESIHSANQFTNLICTLPVDWPAKLKIKKPDGEVATLHVRLLGLPYPKPPAEPQRRGRPPNEPDSEQEQQEAAMRQLLSAAPNQIRLQPVNRQYTNLLLNQWRTQHQSMTAVTETDGANLSQLPQALKIVDSIFQLVDNQETLIGTQTLKLSPDGRFHLHWKTDQQTEEYLFDGKSFYFQSPSETWQLLPTARALSNISILQALSLGAFHQESPFQLLGKSFIDGGDKAIDKPAFRLSITGLYQNRFFYWLSLENDRQENDRQQSFHPQLLKISTDKDSRAGAVLFSDWKWVSSDPDPEMEPRIRWQIPLQRKFVQGLEEHPLLILRNQEVGWIDQLDTPPFQVDETSSKQD